MFFSNKKLIGIDIGSSSIKVSELDVSARSAQLVGFTMMPTPEGSVLGGDIQDAGAISQVVISLVQELKTKRKNAAIGLWGTSVVVKRISIPKMDEKLIGGQIRWEAEQYIPFDINDVHVDYKLLKGISSSPETMDILLVAAKKDSIFTYQDVIQGSGLTPAVVDLSSFALANCLVRNYPECNDMTVAVMDMGASVTNFVVLDKGEVVFYRDIPVGGLTYTSEVQKSMNVSFAEAESLKIGASQAGTSPEELLSAIKASHEVVIEEFQNSIDFFTNTTPGMTVARMYFTGGGFRTLDLVSQAEAAMKVPFEFFNPLQGIQIKQKNFTTDYLEEVRALGAVSLGLGMRKVGDN
jgi:type IV pilus assembly protein PilM